MKIYDNLNLNGAIIPGSFTNTKATTFAGTNPAEGTLIWNGEENEWQIFNGTSFIALIQDAEGAAEGIQTWSSNKTYGVGDLVTITGKTGLYQAAASNTNKNPETNTTNWINLSSSDSSNISSDILIGQLFYDTDNTATPGKLFAGNTYNWSDNPKLKAKFDANGHNFITDEGNGTFTIVDHTDFIRAGVSNIGTFVEDSLKAHTHTYQTKPTNFAEVNNGSNYFRGDGGRNNTLLNRTTGSTGSTETAPKHRTAYFGIYGDQVISAIGSGSTDDFVPTTIYDTSTELIAIETGTYEGGELAYIRTNNEFVIFDKDTTAGKYTPTLGGGSWYVVGQKNVDVVADRFLLNQTSVTKEATRYYFDNNAVAGLALPIGASQVTAAGIEQGSWIEVINTRSDDATVTISGPLVKANGTGGNIELGPSKLIKLVYRGTVWYESASGGGVELQEISKFNPDYYSFTNLASQVIATGTSGSGTFVATQLSFNDDTDSSKTNIISPIANGRFRVAQAGVYSLNFYFEGRQLSNQANNGLAEGQLYVRVNGAIQEDLTTGDSINRHVNNSGDMITMSLNGVRELNDGDLVDLFYTGNGRYAIIAFGGSIVQESSSRIYSITNNTNNITLTDGQTLADVTEPLRAKFYGSTANIASTDSTGLEGGELAFVRNTKELYVFDREVRSYGDVSPMEGGGTYKKVTDKSLVSTDQFEYASNSNGEYEWNKVTGVIKMWGTIAGSQNADGTQTLPTSFDNTDYSITATFKNPVSTTAIYSVNVSAFTTNAFNFTRRLLEADETTIGEASSEQVCWQAIGRKVST